MPDFDHVLNEAMRFHPAVTLIPRRSTRDTVLGGYRIPANTMLYIFAVWAQTHDDY